MKRFKLDLVTDRLGLPTFNHHRADDDALACGRIMAKLLDMLAERGITQQSEVSVNAMFALVWDSVLRHVAEVGQAKLDRFGSRGLRERNYQAASLAIEACE